MPAGPSWLETVRAVRRLANADDTDEVLVRQAGAGDRPAAAILIERHTDKIFAVCYRMLGSRAAAEDASQETFLRLWKHAATWKPKGAKFETWLYRVAMNYCLDQLRKSGRERPEEDAPEMPDGAAGPADHMLENERRQAIEAAIEGLPDRQRMAIVLCHLKEMSNIEAAEVMGVSVEATESLLSRARRALRGQLAPMKEHIMGTMNDDGTTKSARSNAR